MSTASYNMAALCATCGHNLGLHYHAHGFAYSCTALGGNCTCGEFAEIKQCLYCGHADGTHGQVLVHERYGNGGGGNHWVPCPLAEQVSV